MRILCLDTATDLGSVAVVVDGAVRAERSTPVRARLGETLLGEIEQALATAGLAPADVDLCAVGTGPGSFTGLRVGLAVAKGLFLARGTPLVGIPTSRTLAHGAQAATSVVAIDARKDEAFIACFRRGQNGALDVLLEHRHGSPRAMGAAARAALGPGARPLVLGTGASAELLAGLGEPHERAPEELDHPRAALMAPLAQDRLLGRGADDPSALAPEYVRGADVTPSAVTAPPREP